MAQVAVGMYRRARGAAFLPRALAVVAAWAAAAIGPAGAEETLTPPAIRDMLLVGHAGASRSTVSRSVLLVGKHLYVSGEPGLQTIDVSDPSKLRLTSDWTKSSPKMNGAAVKGKTLYVTNWSPGEGLVLFDLADPARPAHLKTIRTPIHSWEVNVHGDLLDVSLGNETKSLIQTYDIRDPRNPVPLHALEIDDRLIGNASRYGGHLYFTHKHFLCVYEAKDPAKPRRVRQLAFNGLCGETQVRGKHLYMLVRQVGEGEQGGVRAFSLEDPSDPKLVGFWEQNEPRDMHFQGDLLIVPASGSGIYTLDARDPANLKVLAHWGVSWPGTGHGGYAVTVAGSGKHVYVGTTGGNNKDCEDFATCPYYGARVYAAEIGP